MSVSKFTQPSQQDLTDFVKGDPVAISRVMDLIVPQLCRWAIKTYPLLDKDDVSQVVFDVAVETCLNHARYNPDISQITTYLINLIRLRMTRLRKTTQKVKNKEEDTETVRDNASPDVYNTLDVEKIEIDSAREKFFNTAREQLEALDKEFFELMLQDAPPEAYVQALEHAGSFPDPAKEVKNRKRRIHRKLKVIADGLRYSLEDLLKR